jgi:hypothetical protein
MSTVIGVLALVVLLGLIVVHYGVTIGALAFGRKVPWLWFTLAVFMFVSKLLSVALFKETDTVRGLVSLAGAVVAAVMAWLLQRRLQNVVLVVGGFLGAGLIIIQVLGPLLNPAPQWLVLGFLFVGGIAGAVWACRDRSTATIVLSALIGAGVLSSELIDLMGIDEPHRFQVLAVLALVGIGIQTWLRRREMGAAATQAQGV